MKSKIRFCMIRKEIYFYKTASGLLFFPKSQGPHAYARTDFAPKRLLSEQQTRENPTDPREKADCKQSKFYRICLQFSLFVSLPTVEA